MCDSLCFDTREAGKPTTSQLLSVNTRRCAIQDKEWKTPPVRGFYQQCSIRSIRVPVVLCCRGLLLCTEPRVLPSIMQRVNIAGCRCCVVWFHGTHSWWKWRSATGYLNIRGSQEHAFIVPAHAPLQIDFLQQAHAHANRSQMLPWTGQWNQLMH